MLFDLLRRNLSQSSENQANKRDKLIDDNENSLQEKQKSIETRVSNKSQVTSFLQIYLNIIFYKKLGSDA